MEDDGPGIPPRLAERLFEPFVSSKSSEGTGLGLTIVRRVVERHGGAIRACIQLEIDVLVAGERLAFAGDAKHQPADQQMVDAGLYRSGEIDATRIAELLQWPMPSFAASARAETTDARSFARLPSSHSG